MNKRIPFFLNFMLVVALLGAAGWSCNKNGSRVMTASPELPTNARSASPGSPSAHAKRSTAKNPDDINPPPDVIPAIGEKLELSREEWKERLTPEQFKVLRMQGTEYPGTGAYNKHYEEGTYHCSACNNPLFSSETKFDSKTGWPSFYAPIEDGRVGERRDHSHGMKRVEVVCAHCGGHLGHIFNDGPPPTNLRYCVNSVALYFRPDESVEPVEPVEPVETVESAESAESAESTESSQTTERTETAQ